MRRTILFVLALSVMLGVSAQGVEYHLSDAQIAVKVSDPSATLQSFAPLVEMIRAFFYDPTAKTGDESPVDFVLDEGIPLLSRFPGVDGKGDFWLIVPTLPTPMKNLAVGVNTVNPGAAPAAPDVPAIYVLAPVTNAGRATALLEQLPQMAYPSQPHGKVCGAYAVIAFGDTKLPDWDTVDNDLKIISMRSVVVSMKSQALPPLPTLPGPGDVAGAGPVPNAGGPAGAGAGAAGAGMMGPGGAGPANQVEQAGTVWLAMMTPMYTYAQNLEKEEARTEMGFAMVGDSLSMEARVIPVDGSDLAKGLATAQPDTTAIDLAALLPADMAVVGASGPMPAGIPSPVDPLMQSFSALATTIMPAEKADPFLASFRHLIDQTTQGSAVGVTAVPTYKNGDPTVVGIFKVKSTAEAQGAVSDFVRDFHTFTDNVFGGGLSKMIDLEVTPGAEKVGDVSVDVLKLTVRQMQPVPDVVQNGAPPPPDAGAPPAAPPQMVLKDVFTQDWRVAYDGDKMLFTLGNDGQNEMILLVNRVNDKTPGFTASARFKALKGDAFPAEPQSFYYMVPTDVARAIVAALPDNAYTDNVKAVVSVLPPQRTAIYGYREIQDGMMYAEVRVPLEQLDLLYMAGKAAFTIGSMQKVSEQAQPAPDQTPPGPNAGDIGAPPPPAVLPGDVMPPVDLGQVAVPI